MTGAELTIGGWFASAVIGKLVDVGRSYLGNKYDQHSETGKMLKNLKGKLPHIQSVIEAAEKRQTTNNSALAIWLEMLKNAAYEAEDVVDDFEAKRIRKDIKGSKGNVTEMASSSVKLAKTLIFSDKYLNKLESVVNTLDNLCMGDFINTVQLTPTNRGNEHLETTSTLDPVVPIFGRDEEIQKILDMIFNVPHRDFNHKALDDPNLRQGEGEGSSNLSYTNTFKTYLSRGGKLLSELLFIQTVKKGDAPEQSKKGLLDVGESGKTIKKGDNIVSTITTSSRNLKLVVIPIRGPSGVGKTTIAKKIYNDESVTDYFYLQAWVYVSDNYDAKKIRLKMLYSFIEYGGTELGSTTECPEILEIIEKRLIKTIKNKRFLLILDDMRDITHLQWSDLNSVLCHGLEGSVVVVTTQSISIANVVGTMPEVTLDPLQKESFRELFQYFAFRGTNFGDLPLAKQENLKNIGEEIVKNLKGLPLSGKVIGTLLSTRLEEKFWEQIWESNWWNIEAVRKDILPSIGVGYDHLDPELKQCFVFCSIFPKNYVFERKRLVQMWIAHGFIQPGKEEITVGLDEGENRLEDIGRNKFDKLVDISFFQATLTNGNYVMHDLVRDLALAVSSKEFSFLKSYDKHLPILARHLGRDCDNSEVELRDCNNSEVEWICNDSNSTRLRTVILFGSWADGRDEKSISNVFAKSNGLRVLDISHNVPKKTASVNVPEKNAPIDAASRLSHLRFLDLSFTGIESIPEEICALYHLQVLDLRGCNFKKLPEGMSKLINLQHLYASSDTISLITNIGKLTKLQELEEFLVISKKGTGKGHRISELKHMNELSGHLLLSKLQNVSSKEEAAESQLHQKKYLKSLEFRFEYNFSLEILDALKPTCNIEILKVEGGKGKSFPSWMFSSLDGFKKLKDIHVSSFWLENLPAFGELPSLEHLSIDDFSLIKEVGSEFYGSSNEIFPNLKELKFSRMSNWKYWSGAEAGKVIFRCLQKLHLEECHVLEELPTGSFNSSVVELKLSECLLLRYTRTVVQGMSSLARLTIINCHDYASLARLTINNCVIYCTVLESLEVLHLQGDNGFSHVRFVGGLKSLVNLREFVIKDFSDQVQQTYEERPYDLISEKDHDEHCLQFLTYLHLCNSSPKVGRLPSLRTLLIENSNNFQEYEDIWLGKFTSLEKLEFRNCKRLTVLPSTLHLLTSLEKLHISDCPDLHSLPEKGLPEKLKELYIEECPHLIHQCQPNQGDDWHKICHIRYVHLIST